jgi:hypothetical protein
MLEPYQSVNQSFGPPPTPWTRAFAYDASGSLEYEGWAYTNQREKTDWTIAEGGITQIVVAANVATVTFGAAHGLEVGHDLDVSKSGVTGLNGSYVVATVPTSATLTFATSGVADGTYTGTSMQVESISPRKNAAVWVIRKNVYDGTGNLTAQKWAKGQSQTANLIWDNRTTYVYR